MKYPVGRPSIGALEVVEVLATLQSGRITHGARVEEFERLFAQYLGVEHAIVCSSGTAALHLALAAAGIGPGDEVLVPDVTYVATINAVSYVGATPVLVDIRAKTWEISLEDAEQKVSSRTKAILPVHLYGVPCDMTAVLEFADRHGILVIEDASEGLGGFWQGTPCGTVGLCGTFSFYANKIITTGEGGAVVTDDGDLAQTLRFLRGQAHSSVRRFWHSEIGFNYRMTDIQAALGIAQLRQFPLFLQQRETVMEHYATLIGRALEVQNASRLYARTAPWLFTALLPSDTPYHHGVEGRMAEREVEVRPVFVPMHRLPMYARPDTQFPVACRVGDFGISLPTYPGLTFEDVEYIVSALFDTLGMSGGASCMKSEETHTTTS